jgi:hypothetical protein
MLLKKTMAMQPAFKGIYAYSGKTMPDDLEELLQYGMRTQQISPLHIKLDQGEFTFMFTNSQAYPDLTRLIQLITSDKALNFWDDSESSKDHLQRILSTSKKLGKALSNMMAYWEKTMEQREQFPEITDSRNCFSSLIERFTESSREAQRAQKAILA